MDEKTQRKTRENPGKGGRYMDYKSAKHLYGIINHPSPLILRLLRGCTSQTRLASKLKVATNTITDWERGISQPTPDNLSSLLAHFTDWTRALAWPGLDILTAAAESEEHQTKRPQGIQKQRTSARPANPAAAGARRGGS